MEKIRYFYHATIQKAKDLWTFVKSDEFLSWDLHPIGVYGALYFGIVFLPDTTALPGVYGMVADLFCTLLIMFGLIRLTNFISEMYHKLWVAHQLFSEMLQEMGHLEARIRELEREKKPMGD